MGEWLHCVRNRGHFNGRFATIRRMTLQLNLPPDLEQQLRRRLGTTGDVESFAIEALRQSVAAEDAIDAEIEAASQGLPVPTLEQIRERIAREHDAYLAGDHGPDGPADMERLRQKFGFATRGK
jgi:hypothetical protein